MLFNIVVIVGHDCSQSLRRASKVKMYSLPVAELDGAPFTPSPGPATEAICVAFKATVRQETGANSPNVSEPHNLATIRNR